MRRQDLFERDPLRISTNPLPKLMHFSQHLQIVREISQELRTKVLYGNPLRFVIVDQSLYCVLISCFEVIKQLIDMFLADIYPAVLRLVNEALIGSNESLQSQPKGVEAALQSLDQQYPHELRQVHLALLIKLVDVALVVVRAHRFVSGVLEFQNDTANRFAERMLFLLAEGVEQCFGIGHLRELQALRGEVLAVVLENLVARPSDHQVLQHTITNCVRVRADDGKVRFSIRLAIQTLELAL